MKPGDLVEVGIEGQEKPMVGVLIEDCPPDGHVNGLHLVQVLHEDFLKWWPASYVRRINESR